MKILLIEDDIEISEMLQSFLLSESFEVDSARDGEDGLQKFAQETFDLVLLDIMIPKLNGIEVMQNIRSKSTVPIIIISAKDTDLDKSLGLGLGADDYITKPFSITEVLARIKANIRRSTQYSQNKPLEAPHLLTTYDIALNVDDYTVSKGNKKIELTAKEFDILKLLIQNPKKVYTKAQLYTQIWNDAYIGDENAVNVHISRLRAKIEDDSRNPKYIETVWGIGYKLGEGND
ncbi:response regulator transcription factor [Desulfosporosinus lacus]|uniref:Stage 0 sporulation protein A homolog n=1 Tax=Desulfosporosinus lacus DSM 15449 TaxID=1121420 RepID=A0A1M5ZBF9_9FIRM|nr:response regulator transcription factor [Desulfosporosinus lacus]SHI21550.1 DNA-binding response regulator, OmpR family, contains REC and winged-helix (wHTH) domain [Desulfosporosinus lacus DSM 15449]